VVRIGGERGVSVVTMVGTQPSTWGVGVGKWGTFPEQLTKIHFPSQKARQAKLVSRGSLSNPRSDSRTEIEAERENRSCADLAWGAWEKLITVSWEKQEKKGGGIKSTRSGATLLTVSEQSTALRATRGAG